MKCKTQVGLAIGAGYLLGRRRKTRLALMVGGAALTGGLGGAASRLTSKIPGGGLVSSDLLERLSPEVSQLTEAVRGELFELGKTAARAAVSNQVDALTGKLHDRAGSLRDRISERADVAGQAGRLRDVSRQEQDGNEPSEEAGNAGNGSADEAGSEDQPRARRAASGTSRRASDEASAPRASRSRASSGSRAASSTSASGSGGTSRRAAGTRRASASGGDPPVRRRSSSSTRSGTGSRSASSNRRSGSSGR